MNTQSNRGNATIVSLIVILVIGTLLALGSCAVVPPGHRGISVTLGKVSPLPLGEGLTLKKPFIESIVPMSVKQNSVTTHTACFTSDLQTITITYACLYRFPENRVVELYQQYSGSIFEGLIEPRYQEALKQVTATYTAENVVKNRDQIKAKALEKLRAELNDIVTIIDIPITNIDLSNELEKAIETKQVMQQQALAKQYELEKEQKEAEITAVKATAEANAVQIKGAALKSSPEVISFEIAKRWDGHAPQSVVVTNGGANVLLPLK